MGKLQREETEEDYKNPEHVLCFLHKVLKRKGSRTHKTAGVQDMPAQVLLWCTVCLELEAPEGKQGQRELSLNPLICQNTELP